MMRPFELMCEIPEADEDGYPEVHLRGCFDANGVRRLEGAGADILESGKCHVILDLEELDYISSAGIGSIMAFFQALRSHDGSMVLLRPSRRVMDLLHILGFSKLFPIADTRASAGDILNAARRA